MPAIRAKSAAELLGVPQTPRTGRDRLIAASIELFYRYGFGAVGIDRVLVEAGVTKTTFYKHFEGKDDLMVAAVKRRDEWEWQAWARAVRRIAGDDPAKQLIAIFDVMDIWFNDPDFHGCMFMNTAAEFPNPNDPVHQAASEYRRRGRDARRDMAIAAGAERAAAETFADCYTAMLEGAITLRHTHGRNDAARVVRPMVEQLIRTYIPVKPGARDARTRPRRGGRSVPSPSPRKRHARR